MLEKVNRRILVHRKQLILLFLPVCLDKLLHYCLNVSALVIKIHFAQKLV